MSKGLFNSTPIHISQVETLEIQLENFFSSVGLERQYWAFVGSIGKKEFSVDVDVAVQINDSEGLVDWAETFEQIGLEYKISKGFNLISLGFPLRLEPLQESQIIQVDLFLTQHLDWVKFIRYAPNLSAGESKFEGIYRNLLLSAIAITESRQVSGNTIRQFVIRFDEGLFAVVKERQSETAKTSKVVQEYFVTADPEEFASFLDLKFPIKTFEQVWVQVRNRNKFSEIKERFEKFCNMNKLEIKQWD